MTVAAEQTTAGRTIYEVEKALLKEIDGVSLVGEIDLDEWGPIANEAIQSKLPGTSVERLGRLWPATLVTYLVHQGVHVYDDATFWPNVPLVPLQQGGKTGPAFWQALEALDLPVFADLEANEGFGLNTKHKYVRRILLHGGLPRNATVAVFDLLASTLRAGAMSAAEVVDQWASLDLFHLTRSKAAQRLFVYTGDFGVRLVEQLITLLRIANRGGDLRVEGVPSHLVDGLIAYMAKGSATSFPFTAGPRVRLEPGRTRPELVVPRAANDTWRVNGRWVGTASRQVEMRFPLPPPAKGSRWEVTSSGSTTTRRFASESAADAVFVFDERGRLHPRGTTLGGVRAKVIVPTGSDVADEVDREAVAEDWPDHELVTVDLRGSSALLVSTPSGELLEISVDTALDVRLDGDLIDGVTNPAGWPLYGTKVGLVFGRYVPDPDDVTVTIDGTAHTLASLPENDGTFDLTPRLRTDGSGRVRIVVSRDGSDPVQFNIARLPGCVVERPHVAPATGEVLVCVRYRPAWANESVIELPFPDGATLQPVTVGGVQLRVELNRLRWAVDGPHTVAPMAGSDQFVLRADELRDTLLRVHTGGAPVRVALLGADVVHEGTPRRDRRDPAWVAVAAREFLDTCRNATAARTRVAVLSDLDGEPIEIGMIEARFEPIDLHIDEDALASRRLSVHWRELTNWAKRVVRLWAADGEAPVTVVRPADGERSVDVELSDLPDGRYFVEVTTESGWGGTPTRPVIGASCVPLYLGSPDGLRLRDAVMTADRRARFSDDELDEHVPVLADLTLELMPTTGTAAQRTALIERVADDQWRVVDTIDEIADRFPVDDDEQRRNLLEPFLVEMLPVLFDFPVRNTTERETWRLEHLWEIAPLAAACLDAARDDDRCHERWADATGITTESRGEPSKALNRLASQLPLSLESERDPVELLGPDAWSDGYRELDRVANSTYGRSFGTRRRSLMQAVTGLGPDGHFPRWKAAVTRVHDACDESLGAGCELMVDLVALACAHLDRETVAPRDQVLDVLLGFQAVAPTAVRCSLLYAAASLRILEDAGHLAKLVT